MELTKIRGISDKRALDLNKLNIFDTSDLIKHFPRAYLDMRSTQPLGLCYHNDIVLTVGKVVSLPTVRYFRRGGMVKVSCEQDGLFFSITWFNQPYVASRLKAGEEYLFYGRVRREDNVISLVNPSFEPCEKVFRLQGIVPQYQIKGGLTQKVLRDAIRLSVNLEKPSTIIPYYLQQKYELGDLFSAYKEVHNPTDFTKLKKASNRIAIEEYFALISAFKVIKGGAEQIRRNKYNCTKEQLNEFISGSFPFEFTDGQKEAVKDIFTDLTGQTVMNRLMQGDVGSGKTAVALCSIYVAVKSGFQAVMLAPTEVLATQNFNAVKNALGGYSIALLTGSLTAKEKREIKNRLKNGEIDVLVGTHAVLEESVEFNNLSLCVCDEQHRFGVAQRSSLMNKGVTPDVLVLSATPIPRTLSLIFYGDLDITTIKDKPKSRQVIQTNIVPTEKYEDMLGFIKREVQNGNQAYFVCPRIDGDDEGTLISATELYEDVSQKLQDVKVGLLHGKLKNAEKNSIMQDFKDKKIDILVSTTVIEVGVDVPDATVMVIYDAERFGLSTLHQLRGRVGRSNKKSYCFLLTKSKTQTAIDRLKVIKDNSNGFEVSSLDYKMRGSGDFMGERQSGKLINDLGALNYTTDAIFLAKKLSDEAFDFGVDLDKIKKIAMERYDKLMNITLN